MNKTPTDLKVYVSDEIIDLKRSIEDKRAVYSNSLHRTRSQNEIGVDADKKDLTERLHIPQSLNSVEKIPKALYASLPNSQRFRRPKQKPRSKTVDPRFRRSRSPTNQLPASRSTKILNNPLMVQIQDKQISASSPTLLQDQGITPISTSDNVREEITQPTIRKQRSPERRKIQVPTEIELTQTVDSGKSSENIHGGSKKDDECPNTVISSGAGEEISPYWYDDRVIEKYKSLLQPVRHHAFTSISHPLKETSNSECTFNRKSRSHRPFQTYKYDDATDIDGYSQLPIKEVVPEERPDIPPVLPYMMLGCIIGIIIATSISWTATQYFDWNFTEVMKFHGYFSKNPSHHKETQGLFNIVINIGKGVLYGVEKVFRTIAWLLATPRGEIFHRVAADTNSDWFTWWKSFI